MLINSTGMTDAAAEEDALAAEIARTMRGSTTSVREEAIVQDVDDHPTHAQVRAPVTKNRPIHPKPPGAGPKIDTGMRSRKKEPDFL